MTKLKILDIDRDAVSQLQYRVAEAYGKMCDTSQALWIAQVANDKAKEELEAVERSLSAQLHRSLIFDHSHEKKP